MTINDKPTIPEPHGILERVLHSSIRNRGLVVLAAVALALLGVYSFLRLPIDAVPDITNVQVQINTAVEGLPNPYNQTLG